MYNPRLGIASISPFPALGNLPIPKKSVLIGDGKTKLFIRETQEGNGAKKQEAAEGRPQIGKGGPAAPRRSQRDRKRDLKYSGFSTELLLNSF